MEKAEIIKYLASISSVEREKLLLEVRNVVSEKANKQYAKNRSAYANTVARKEQRGIEMSKKVVPGMFVICEGTRDRLGLREVVEVNDDGIVARKIEKYREASGVFFVRAPYITEHLWSKIKRVVSGNIVIK